MEQLEFDCRLESERELEENVNIALEFACKQVKETSKSKVSNRHDGYGIASEFYAGMKLDQKKVDESMKDFLRILENQLSRGSFNPRREEPEGLYKRMLH